MILEGIIFAIGFKLKFVPRQVGLPQGINLSDIAQITYLLTVKKYIVIIKRLGSDGWIKSVTCGQQHALGLEAEAGVIYHRLCVVEFGLVPGLQ